MSKEEEDQRPSASDRGLAQPVMPGRPCAINMGMVGVMQRRRAWVGNCCFPCSLLEY